MKRKKWKVVGITVIVIAAIVSIVILPGRSQASEFYAIPFVSDAFYDDSYRAYLESHGFDGTLAEGEVVVDLSRYTASEDMEVEVGADGIITSSSGSITWEFQVKEAGFYNLEVGYIAVPGTNSDIQRRILLDGEICYDGLQQVVFKRWWSDEEINKKNGNEIRPKAEEIYKEVKVFVEDSNRRVGEPFLFYLSKGTHTITFEVIKEPIEYTSLVFKAAPKPDSYSNVIEELKKNYPVYDGDIIICQAERPADNTVYIEKSSPTINIKTNYSDSRIEPYHPYRIVYNTIGADSWKQPGDSITWEATVPREGLYTLTFKGRQSLQRGVTSYRRLYINREVPYKEMNSIGFDYNGDMVNYTITNEQGEPYLFYLKEGSNTITLENVMGPFGGILHEIEESMHQLNSIYLKVIQITGQVPDKFIDYEIAEKVPDFVEVMSNESKRLYEIVDRIVKITGEKGEKTSLLEKMAMEAAWLAEDPESVTEELTQLKNNISALGTWLVQISEMPLEIDSLIIGSAESKLPRARANFFESLYYGFIRFMSTFFISSNQISADAAADADNSIKVWMAAGREQAQIVQNMIDESFTPNTGIQVNLQLIPIDVVLRAALAGNGPDVVIGLAQGTLQDFAMRNAIVDLSQLDSFEEVISKYYKSAIDSATYQGGVYGLAEQENFMMLFYRKDILEELGLSIPRTWDEVREMIPVLKKYNYDFYLPSTQASTNLYASLVYQYGGDLYEGEGNDYGIESALDNEPAMLAFKDYTDFYTSYGLLVKADFPNRFRTGEMPIGITNYTTYCQLEIFAPEIKGLWSFAPLPGVEQEDGTINHSYLTDTVHSVIMRNRDNLEASWEFLKWWTSTESQLQYANTLESIMGTAARYPAADPNVLRMLPWSNMELEQLLNQMEDNVGLQAVPGHYMTTRMIQYAFNSVVAELSNPRESLYLYVKSIDEELTKKRLEFNLSTLDRVR